VSENSSKTYLLSDLEVLEVSLVRKPANGRVFHLMKSADEKESSMTLDAEKIAALLETPAENEEQLNELISKEEMSEDAVRAVRAALRLLDAFKDEVPSDTLRGLAAAAGMDLHMEEERQDMDEDEESDDMGKGYQKPSMKSTEDLLKSADIPDSLRPTLEKLWKSSEESRARVNELESVLKSERDDMLHKSETQRVAKSFGHVPGVDAEKLAETLIAMRKASPEGADAFEDVLTATEAAMVAKADGAFEETGTTVPTDSGGRTAWAKIEGLAGELVTKGDAPSRAKAIDHVLTQNPELYSAYLAEKA
jgi:hypothetical protein